MRFYGLDLRVQYLTESVRRMAALIKNLPSDSATWGQDPSWTIEQEMSATAVELADGWGRLTFAAAGGDVNKVKDARDYGLRVKRPTDEDDEPERVVTTDTRVIAAWFAAHH